MARRGEATQVHEDAVAAVDQLLDGIHGTGEGEVLDRAIDVYIKRLREKLGDDANTPRYVATVRGVGYRAAGRVERRRVGPAR